MRSWTLFVQLGWGDLSSFGCSFDQTHHLMLIPDVNLLQTFNVDLSTFQLLELQIAAPSKHINQLLFIQFSHRALNPGFIIFDAARGKYLPYASVDESIVLLGFFPEDSVGLSWASLAVCKDSAIIPLKQTFAHVGSYFIINSLLIHFLVENPIETVVILIHFDSLFTHHLQTVSLF